MKSLVTRLSLVSLLMMLLSCEVLSPILTKNYFEEFKDYNPLEGLIEESDWNAVVDKDAKLDQYIDIVFTGGQDAKSLYNQLKGEKNYKRAMADDLMKRFNDPSSSGYLTLPVYGSETFAADLNTYQRTAMALAKLEVYGSEEMALTGYDNIIVDFATGEQESSLDNKTVMEYLFAPETSSEYTNSQLINMDITSLYNAGIALSYLGSTIIDRDNPASDFVSENDAVMILISCMINTIITDSVENFIDETAVIDALVSDIESVQSSASGTFFDNLNFPQDKGDTDESTIVQYLGENGAVVYAATGFELPNAESIMGGNE